MSGEKRVLLTETGIAENLYNNLIKLGYTPSTDEVFDIAEIIFDYLIEMDALEIMDDEAEGDN